MLQGPVVENLSKRCGGFLKALSLRGCQVITDQALGYACPLSLGLWIVKGVVVGEGGGGKVPWLSVKSSGVIRHRVHSMTCKNTQSQQNLDKHTGTPALQKTFFFL